MRGSLTTNCGVLLLAAMLVGGSTAPLSALASTTSNVATLPDLRTQLETEKAARARADEAAEAARQSSARAATSAALAERKARAARDRSLKDQAARARADAEARAAQVQAESDRKAAAAAKQKADEARRKSDQAAAEAAAARAKSEHDRLGFVLAIAGAACVALVAACSVFLLRRHFRRRQPPDPVPNGLLRGHGVNLQLSGRQLPDAAGGVVVGRNNKEATAVITEPDVSRRHARFFHRDGRYWLEDIGSAHGTTVEGEPLEVNEPVEVLPGDVITFAGHAFRFDIDA